MEECTAFYVCGHMYTFLGYFNNKNVAVEVLWCGEDKIPAWLIAFPSDPNPLCLTVFLFSWIQKSCGIGGRDISKHFSFLGNSFFLPSFNAYSDFHVKMLDGPMI